MLIVTFVTFALLNLLPGEVSLELLGSDATPSAIARVRSELRLDDPLVVRYMRWLGQALQGDLGRSFITGEPVMAALARSSPGVDRVAGSRMLKLRTIGIRDYSVLEGGQRIGRIRFTEERMPGVWLWNINVHLKGF